ncbi:cysteine synthase A [Altererythrobacter sp. Z27]|uniref:cysteine synthase A n=1 Tax=Altererythrobacter sp. Z27 TaxID=3461147 RepID=UPI0040447C4B
MTALFPSPSLPQGVAGPHGSVLELVGNTPVVLMEKLSPPGREVYVKLEAFNPTASVKDRLAIGLIEAAEADGSLKPGQTVVEATSGNTGIGLAMVCARKGYPLVIVMAESFSIERRKILRYLGAKVVLTPAAEKGTGMLAKARELAETHGWFLPRQFENEANAAIHERTTGMEIVEAFADRPLDFFVSGFGSGGTISGVARALRRHSPDTRVIACEPENSPMLGSGVAQAYHADRSPAGSHSVFRPHPVQGWAPDFIPAIVDGAMRDDLIDEVVPVSGDDAIAWSRRLAREEGIFCGISSGATFATARRIAEQSPEGTRVLAMIPDTAERYMSTPLFADIAEAMDEEELEISRSTPAARFDAPAPATAPAKPVAAPAIASAAALAHVDAIVADSGQPLVFFALQWCEFCWSARKLLDALGVPYRTVALDGPDYADPQWAADVRRAVAERSGAPTIPQIFLGGDHLGGATDLFDAYNEGRIGDMLAGAGLEITGKGPDNAYSMLPAWLQPR